MPKDYKRRKRTEKQPVHEYTAQEAIEIVASQLAEVLWMQYLMSLQEKAKNKKIDDGQTKKVQ